MSDNAPAPIPESLIELERQVLGALFADQDLIDEAVDQLVPSDFRWNAHAHIFEAIIALHEQSQPANGPTVANWLHAAKRIDQVGYPYLGDIMQSMPTGFGGQYLLAKLTGEVLLHRLEHALRQGLDLRYNPQDSPEATVGIAETLILSVSEQAARRRSDVIPLPRALTAAYVNIDQRSKSGHASGAPTGISLLDDMTAGMHPGELLVLAARPSVGKTSLALQIARHAAQHSTGWVLFSSLEMSHLELGERLLCHEARVDSWPIRRGRVSEQAAERLLAATEALANCRLVIDDLPTQSVLRVAAQARRLKRRSGLSLVVVDYLGLLAPEDRRMARHEQVGLAARRLKQLARDLNVPVLVLAQLNRASEGRADTTPKLSDLRDSGEIEQHADVVMLLHRLDSAKGARNVRISLILDKQRNGPVGVVQLDFDSSTQVFEGYAPID